MNDGTTATFSFIWFTYTFNILIKWSRVFYSVPYLMRRRWNMFAKSHINPKRHAFFDQFMLMFCRCNGTALCELALVDDTARTLNISRPLLRFLSPPVYPAWSADMVLKARKEIRPHICVVHRRFPFAIQATFQAFSARLMHLSPPQRHFGCKIRLWRMSSYSLFTLLSGWMLVVHRSLACSGSGNFWRRKAHRGRTDRHRATAYSRYRVMTQLYLGKATKKKRKKERKKETNLVVCLIEWDTNDSPSSL